MPRRDDWQRRIKAVERRFLAIRLGTDRLQDDVRRDSTILQGRVDPRDLTSASEDLEGTYLTRMFAEFETGLRQYWETISDTHPKTKEGPAGRPCGQVQNRKRSAKQRPLRPRVPEQPDARAGGRRSGTHPLRAGPRILV